MKYDSPVTCIHSFIGFNNLKTPGCWSNVVGRLIYSPNIVFVMREPTSSGITKGVFTGHGPTLKT